MKKDLNNTLTIIKKIRPVGAGLIILLTAVFFAKTLTGYYQQLQENLLSISPIRIFISFLLFVGYLYLRALSWKSLVNFLGESIDKTNSLSVWFFSEATRYIPGNIWSFVSRAYLARQKQVSKNVSILVLPTEIIIVTTVASLMSLYAIIKNLEKLPVNSVFYAVLIIPPLALLGFLLLQKIIKRALEKLVSLDLNLKALFGALMFQTACWSLYSAGTIVLVEGKLENLPLLLSSTILAWLLGYLSLITPMGLGIRESAFVLLTGSLIGIPQAIVIAIVSRIILIVAELSILAYLAVFKKTTSDV